MTDERKAPVEVEGLVERLTAMANGLRGSMWADRNEIIGLLDQAATELATLKQQLVEREEALREACGFWSKEVVAVLNCMRLGYSEPPECIRDGVAEDTGIELDRAQVLKIQRALHTLGLAGFGVLYDEDEPRMKGRGYWLEKSGDALRRALTRTDGGDQ